MNRSAGGIEVVSHELRTSIAVEMSTKSCPCLPANGNGSHIYRVCNVFIMIVFLSMSPWQPSLVLEVLDRGTLRDWTPRLTAGLVMLSLSYPPSQVTSPL